MQSVSFKGREGWRGERERRVEGGEGGGGERERGGGREGGRRKEAYIEGNEGERKSVRDGVKKRVGMGEVYQSVG